MQKKMVLLFVSIAVWVMAPLAAMPGVEPSVVQQKKLSRRQRNKIRRALWHKQGKSRLEIFLRLYYPEILAVLGATTAVGAGGWYAHKKVPVIRREMQKRREDRQLDEALRKIVDDAIERGDKQLRPDVPDVEVTDEEIEALKQQDKDNERIACERVSGRGGGTHGSASVTAGIYSGSYSVTPEQERAYAIERIKEAKLERLNNRYAKSEALVPKVNAALAQHNIPEAMAWLRLIAWYGASGLKSKVEGLNDLLKRKDLSVRDRAHVLFCAALGFEWWGRGAFDCDVFVFMTPWQVKRVSLHVGDYLWACAQQGGEYKKNVLSGVRYYKKDAYGRLAARAYKRAADLGDEEAQRKFSERFDNVIPDSMSSYCPYPYKND